MRVMLYCPTYRAEPETEAAIRSIRQRSHQTHSILAVFDDRNIPHEPDGKDRRAILWKYQRARAMFLGTDCEALFVVEDDIIPPADALEKLAAADADIANGLYLYRRMDPISCAMVYHEGEVFPRETYCQQPGGLGAIWGQTVRTAGLGLGCSLIHRRVLEAIPFRDPVGTHCDWALAVDALQCQFKIVCDTSVVCGHKCPDGRILWPAQSGHTVTYAEPSKWRAA